MNRSIQVGRGARSGVRRLVALVAVLLLVAACGGDADGGADTDEPSDDTEEPAEDAGDDGAGDGAAEDMDAEPAEDTDDGAASGPPEQAEVTVATIPIMAMAPFFHALDNGLFEEEGLQVTHAIGSGGAELIPRLLSGEVDLFWSALEPFVVARTEGIEMDVVAPGHFYDVIDASDMGLYALPDAGYASIADLEGATIAINTINTFGHIMTQAALEHQGVDLSTIRWVEIPFPQMGPALERGEVDAAWTPEPFATIMRQNLDVVGLLDPDASEPIMADLPAFRGAPGGAWAATSDFVETNPNTVAAFARAIERANAAIDADHALGIEAIANNTEIAPAVLENAVWPNWGDGLDVESRVQITADLMHQYGILDEPVDTAGWVHATAS